MLYHVFNFKQELLRPLQREGGNHQCPSGAHSLLNHILQLVAPFLLPLVHAVAVHALHNEVRRIRYQFSVWQERRGRIAEVSGKNNFFATESKLCHCRAQDVPRIPKNNGHRPDCKWLVVGTSLPEPHCLPHVPLIVDEGDPIAPRFL